jgi:hypothetical protein
MIRQTINPKPTTPPTTPPAMAATLLLLLELDVLTSDAGETDELDDSVVEVPELDVVDVLVLVGLPAEDSA